MIAFNPVWKGHYDILTHIKRVAKLVIFYPPMYRDWLSSFKCQAGLYHCPKKRGKFENYQFVKNLTSVIFNLWNSFWHFNVLRLYYKSDWDVPQPRQC